MKMAEQGKQVRWRKFYIRLLCVRRLSLLCVFVNTIFYGNGYSLSYYSYYYHYYYYCYYYYYHYYYYYYDYYIRVVVVGGDGGCGRDVRKGWALQGECVGFIINNGGRERQWWCCCRVVS